MGRLAFPMLIGQAAAPSAGAVLLVHFGGHGVLMALLWMAVATLVSSALLVPFAMRLRAKALGEGGGVSGQPSSRITHWFRLHRHGGEGRHPRLSLAIMHFANTSAA